jgi:sugar lactone lactonase YvrE
LFVADCRNNAIRSIDTASGDVITLAGSTMRGGVDGVGSAALFSLLLVGAYPAAGLGSDAAGHVFVSDSWNHAIRQIDVGTRKVTTLAGHLVPSGVGLQGTQDDLLGDNARFRWPGGMAEDAGKLYIVDASNTIRVVDSRTTSVTTLAGDPTASGSEDGIGANAHFKFSCTTLTGVAADAGALYVSDCGNATIRRIDEQSGAVTTLAGSAGNTGSADGKGAAARFERPSGIAADHAGNLYIADGSTLRKLVIASGEVSTIVGTPGSVPGYQTGPLPARLASPTGVAILANGEIAISDAAQNAVFVVRH